jgi:flagellar basal-body rod modification protein FlgD
MVWGAGRKRPGGKATGGAYFGNCLSMQAGESPAGVQEHGKQGLMETPSESREKQGGKMATAVLNHHVAAAANGVTAKADATSSTTSTTTDSATISANDFLTLLVTELKNQDPTTATDPTQYINQLVNVNSLEQLISINQTLTTDLGSSTTSSDSSSSSAQAVGATTHSTGATTTASNTANSVASGNLSVPAANSAAERVARSLSGQQ